MGSEVARNNEEGRVFHQDMLSWDCGHRVRRRYKRWSTTAVGVRLGDCV